MLNHRIITIEKGRDAGKTFKITEMPASRLEKWAARALLAVFAGEVPSNLASMAKASNAAALVTGVMEGLGAIRWEAVEPLYDELLTCIARVPDPANTANVVPLLPSNVDAHVQDVGTLLRLRAAALEECFAFFGDGGGLLSRVTQAMRQPDAATTSASPTA